MSDVPSQRAARFIEDVTDDLESGSVSFPTHLDATLRIRSLMDRRDLTAEELARAVATEPLLAAKLLRLANSAALHPSGKEIVDVKAAVMRVGFAQIRTLAFAVALDQLRQARELGPLRESARQLWEHSVHVAAAAYVIARKLTRLNAEEALFAGIVHDIGQFYLLSRVPQYPELLDEKADLSALMFDLHKSVGHAVLESLSIPQEVVRAVDDHEIFGDTFPPQTLGDVLFIANQVAAVRNPLSHKDPYSEQVMREAATFGWDRAVVDAVMAESAAEAQSLVSALRA